MSFKTFGTAGDAGLCAESPELGGVLADLALGLCSLSSASKNIKPRAVRKLSLDAENPQSLLVNFLNELVFLIDTEGFLASSAEVSAGPADGGWKLRASLKGETGAFKKHSRGLLVKAATYHKLLLENKDGLWRARVILDI